MLNLTFWTSVPSFYQCELFRALARLEELKLRVIFEHDITSERTNLGWQNDLWGFDYQFIDNHRPVIDAIRKVHSYAAATNVVSGLWAGKVQESVLATLFVSRAKYFIYSEAPDPSLRLPSLKKKLLTAAGKRILKRASGALAISRFAVDYFRSYDMDRNKIYPFGYFRSTPLNFKLTGSNKQKETVDIVFVGQLVHRKGLDILLNAAEPLLSARQELRLHLIGTGDREQEYRSWVSERGLSSGVFFEGIVESGSVIDNISKFDLLVLPSRWDGWGIVVNEALMAGVPVIVSDMCGAADVVRDGVNGYVFHSEAAGELRMKLETFLGDLSLRKSLADEARKTGRALEAGHASEYLFKVLTKGSFDESLRDAEMSASPTYPWIQNTAGKAFERDT